jgi:hypothetical protein
MSKARWSCDVVELTPTHWRTVFTVGVQSFTLADTYDGDEGRQHCEFIRTMFLGALHAAGFTDAPTAVVR